MNDNFPKLNPLNSSSIEDAKHFSAIASPFADLVSGETTVMPYCSPGDVQYAEDWKHPHFDYTINHLGFRHEKIITETDLAVFGCSFTFGTGLPIEMLWHTLLANKLNTTVTNYGLAGASVESIIDVALIVSNHTKINKIIFLLPSFSRIQIAKSSPYPKDEGRVNYLSLIPNHVSMLCKAYSIDSDKFFKLMPDEEMYKIMKNKLYLVDYVFKQKNIKTYYSSWDPDTYHFLAKMELQGVILPEWTSTGIENPLEDLARDKMHPGIKHHTQFAEQIVELIKDV